MKYDRVELQQTEDMTVAVNLKTCIRPNLADTFNWVVPADIFAFLCVRYWSSSYMCLISAWKRAFNCGRFNLNVGVIRPSSIEKASGWKCTF